MGNFRGYAALLRKIKQRVLTAQQRVIYAANEEMLRMYWDVGEMLQQSQDADGWGKKTLQRLSVDLKNDYSEIKGFTVRNMQYMVQFFNEYNQALTMVKSSASPIAKSLISQLGEYNFNLPVKHLDWTHNLVLMKQVKDIRFSLSQYVFYIFEFFSVDARRGEVGLYADFPEDALGGNSEKYPALSKLFRGLGSSVKPAPQFGYEPIETLLIFGIPRKSEGFFRRVAEQNNRAVVREGANFAEKPVGNCLRIVGD